VTGGAAVGGGHPGDPVGVERRGVARQQLVRDQDVSRMSAARLLAEERADDPAPDVADVGGALAQVRVVELLVARGDVRGGLVDRSGGVRAFLGDATARRP
jgi:hypothetical protein